MLSPLVLKGLPVTLRLYLPDVDAAAAVEAGARVSMSVADMPQPLDGPFTEAKEMVGGFFLIDVASREHAVGIASRSAAVRFA